MHPTDTTELPAIMHIMSVHDLATFRAHIQSVLPSRAEVHLSIHKPGDHACLLSIYPNGYRDASCTKSFFGPDWASVLPVALEYASSISVVTRENDIRKLALDIIDLTDQHGNCTRALLRARSHTSEHLDDYLELACARATEMAGNSPYTVTE